jgi:serine acetyltransferase
MDHTILLELTEEKVLQWEALENIRVAHQIKIAAEAAVDKDFMALAEAAEAAEIGAQAQAQMVEDMADLV